MSEQFLSEIRMMSFNFPPRGWVPCDGRLLPISPYQALFSLLGTTYGGNGTTTFALPDLRGRVPIHRGSGHALGEKGGEVTHALTNQELPQHTHVPNGSVTPADSASPTTTSYLGRTAGTYTTATNLAPMSPAAVTSVGGSQPHTNLQPYLVVMFCIATEGVFPSQT